MKSASRKPTDECARFGSSLTPFIDGELDPGHAADMEAHMIACDGCVERLSLIRATRHSLKRTSERRAPRALCARVRAAMEHERASDAQEQAAWRGQASDDASPRLIRFRYAFGLAAAAGVVFAVGTWRYARPSHGNLHEERATWDSAAVTNGSLDALIADLVSLHADPLPPETTNPDEMRRWDPLVGVPVRRPVFQPFGADFNGGRVLATAYRRAAMLQYTVHGGHRVTMYVFNPRDVNVGGTHLESRVVRQRPIYVGKMRGYSVAAAEARSGVGYALATDLDSDESSQMLAAAVQQ